MESGMCTAENAYNNKGQETVEVHELAKGWKAAIARAIDPSTR